MSLDVCVSILDFLLCMCIIANVMIHGSVMCIGQLFENGYKVKKTIASVQSMDFCYDI